MSGLLEDPQVRWALLLIILVPSAMLVAGEFEERLRQRDSSAEILTSLLRRWVLPLLTLWAVLIGVLALPESALAVRLATTALLVAAALLALVAIRLIAKRSRSRVAEGGRAAPQLLLALPRVLVIATVGWLLLDTVWGVDLSAALTALGVTSLVVSLALQDTLSGLASGVLLLGDQPFQPGEWIKCGEDLEGRVVDVNWRSVRIEDRNGDLVVVPNAQLATATVINFDRPTRLHRVVVPVQVAYSNPPTRAKAMLLDAARSTAGVLREPPPKAHVVQVDDPLMGYAVHLWIDDYRIAPRVSSDFGSLVWYASQRHDVPLPSPAYDLYVHDGAADAAGRPDSAELRRRLETSPLLAELDDRELEVLGRAASPRWFAAGEVVSVPGGGADLRLLWRGRARVVALVTGGADIEVTELGPGDLVGLMEDADRGTVHTQVIAVTDCQIVTVPAEEAGAAIGRTPAVAAAVQQVTASRRRRVERLTAGVAGHAAGNGAATDDGQATPASAVGGA